MPAAAVQHPAKHATTAAPAHAAKGSAHAAEGSAHAAGTQGAAKTTKARGAATRRGSKLATRSAKGSRAAANSSHAVRAERFASAPTPVSRQLTSAFVQSETLRPMAQQLAASRSAAAYSGVQAYAAAHPGEGAAAAYMAIGHAYSLDHRYSDAGTAYRQAAGAGNALQDYATYLGAQAALQNRDGATTVGLLNGFAGKYPGSIFAASAPVAQAQGYLLLNDSGSALRSLGSQMGQPASQKADYLLTEGKAHEMAGDKAAAAAIFGRSMYGYRFRQRQRRPEPSCKP